MNTTAHVELSGLTVAGTGHLITPSGAVDLDIHNCTFASTGSSDHLLDCPQWQKIRFVHNSVTTNAGIKLNQYNGGGGSSSCVFTNNDFHNINVPSGSGYRQMFQIDNTGGSSVSGMEIGWNRVTNDSPSVTEIEDCVSIFNTNGASSGDPVRVHDNLFDGCWDPRGAGYSGGGVMLGDNGGSHQLSDGNVVLRTANYGIAIAGGDDCKHQNCTVLSATAAIGSGAAQAAYVWGQGGAATNATITGCDLGLYRGANGMQNVYNPNGEGTFTSNNLRTSCSTGDEDAARTAYLSRAATAGQTFGASGGSGQLAAPANLHSTSVGSTTIGTAWNAVTGAAGYELVVTVTSGGGGGAVLLGNSANGGTSGTAVTTGNSGGASGDAFPGVVPTVVFDNAHYHTTSPGYKLTTGTTPSTSAQLEWSFASATTLYARSYVFIPSLPSASIALLAFTTGIAQKAVLLLDVTTNKLHLWVSGLAEPVTTNAVPTNAWCRIEAKCFASATAGYLEVQLFNSPDSTTPTETISTVTTGNTGTGFDGITFGDHTTLTSPPAGYNYWVDDLAIGIAGYIGP